MAKAIRDFNESLNKAQRGILDFLFPRKCPFCGAPAGKDLLCGKCRESLPWHEGVREGASFGRCGAVFRYEGLAREAILRYKFKSYLDYLPCFGSLMAETAAQQFAGEFDAITWVPVSKKRLRKRGFDQTHYLAASLCVDWHVDPMETLEKIADNPPQSGISDPAERRANVLGVYRAVHPENIAGKRFLLVDDIITTGATLGECVRVLKEAGAADVICITLADAKE